MSGLTFNTDYSGENTEAIGISNCNGVHISNIYVHNGDDSVHATGVGTQNVLVEDSEFHGGHGLSVCGGSGPCEVQNVVFRNSKIVDQSNGARIKAKSDTTGFIRNITWSGLQMYRVKHPIEIEADYHGSAMDSNGGLEIRDIFFENIKARDDMPDGLLGKGGGGDIGSPGDLECSKKISCSVSLKHINIKTSKAWKCNKFLKLTKSEDVSPSLNSCDHS